MAEQHEKITAGDQMVTKTEPSPGAKRVLREIDRMIDHFGMEAVMHTQKLPEDLLGPLCHALGNDKIPEEYTDAFFDIAMRLVVERRIRDDFIKQTKDNTGIDIPPEAVKIGSAISNDSRITQGVQTAILPADVPSPFCEGCGKHHPVHTVSATSFRAATISDRVTGQLGLFIQMFDGPIDEAEGLHATFALPEAIEIGAGIQKAIDLLGSQPQKKAN